MSDRKKHGKREAASGPSRRSCWSRYRAWAAGLSREQRIRYRCLLAAAILALLILAGWAALSAWIRMPDLTDPDEDGAGGTGSVSFEGAEAPDVALSGRKDGVYTFLLAGRDVVSSSTDTILLLSYDTVNKTIQGLNIPRDTMINTSASSKRINSVYARNRGSSDLPEAQRVEAGMEALKQEVAKITGITPDYYVLIEWEAVGELVDALGGVYFEVPFDMDYDDPYQDLHIHQEAGYRKLSGDDAMQVIRWRKNNTGSSGGDVARLEIQQEFLKAVAAECLKPATLLKIPELARIFTEKVDTDLSVGNILALAQRAVGMDPDTGVSFETAPIADSFTYNSAAMITLDGEGILEIVNSGMNPYQRDIDAGDLQLVYRNSDGSFGVTNAALADERMGRPSSSGSSGSSSSSDEEETTDEGQTGDQTGGETGQGGDSSQAGDQTGGETGQGGDSSQTGDQTGGETGQGGDSSQGGDQTGGGDGQGGDSSQGGGQTGGETGQGDGQTGTIDPGEVLPDPEQSVSQGDAPEETTAEDNTVAVLPARPEAVQPAA